MENDAKSNADRKESDKKKSEPKKSNASENQKHDDTPKTGQKQQANQCFPQKLTTTQTKVKNVRDKLANTRQELQQRQQTVQQSRELRQENDMNATKAMILLLGSAYKPNVPQNGSVADVSTNQSSTKEFNNQRSAAQPQKRPQRSTRRELQEQVDGMRELLAQLTLNNPQLVARVRQLAQSNPKLKQVELFSNDNDAACSRNAAKQAAGKARYESEMSNASSTTSQRESGGANPNSEESPKKSRRRQRARNKPNKAPKTQASEEEALAKYINTIVGEYLGEQKERAQELEFKGTADDLEAYAQRLVEAGLGRIVEDEIRINRKNNRQSFITMSADREGTERDGIILLPVARRYAFECDVVRAFVLNAGVATNSTDEKKKPKEEDMITGGKDSFCIADDEDPFTNEEESPDSDLDPNELDTSAVLVSDNCPKAFVISIVKQTELRQVVGTISFKNPTKLHAETNYYKLKPHDMRVPMIYIPATECAAHITSDNKNDICGFLYLAQVHNTDSNGHCIGELLQPVGKVGDLEAEIKAILLHNGLKDVRPYEQRFNDMYAEPDGPFGADVLKDRNDMRKNCVFTIDPLTARDLDDAMSVECVTENLYEVGVHISDVSHYLQEDSELDNIVKDRATSIYLVNEVIHMLPKPLCFKCSLLPGEDKLAFSVFWRMNAHGEIQAQPRFTRSVIKSCTQFAYEHAQKIIDNPNEEFGIDDFPTICNGFTPADIAKAVRTLNCMAQEMRKRRYDNGALSINNPKLRFNLDPKMGEPLDYEVDGRQDANFLIEEFMLLANQSVARFIYDHYPDISILRNHAPPLSKSMKSLREKLINIGIDFDCSSSKALQESMLRICSSAKDPVAMDACLSTLLTKPMARAKYFCSEGKTEEADLWHYALSIPIYTHFTSPIRRYPDILVHRLLAAALNYCPPPKRTTDELHHIAKVCNDQKFNAKNAGDESINLFFKRYIKAKQSITLRAVVTEIFQHLVNVVTIETGHCIGINYKMQKVLVDTTNAPAFIKISEKNSKCAPIKLQLFSTVDVKLVIWDNKICGFFVSPDPKQRQINSIESSKKKQEKLEQKEQQQQQQQLQQQQSVNGGGASSSSNGENDKRAPRFFARRNNQQEQQQQQQTTKGNNKAKQQAAKPVQERVYAVSSVPKE